MDLGLNKLQRLICHKTNQSTNAQNYKVHSKGKVDQATERSSAFSYTSVEGSPLTMVANFTFTFS